MTLCDKVLFMLICILNAMIVDFMTRRLLQRRIYRLFIQRMLNEHDRIRLAVWTVVITGNDCNRFEIDPVWTQSGFKLNRTNLNRSHSIYMWTRSSLRQVGGCLREWLFWLKRSWIRPTVHFYLATLATNYYS
jgi:hypothetical protein